MKLSILTRALILSLFYSTWRAVFLFMYSLIYYSMKSLVVCKRIRAESTEIGTGAIVALDRATSPIIKLLQRKYREDKAYLQGDTAYLVSL